MRPKSSALLPYAVLCCARSVQVSLIRQLCLCVFLILKLPTAVCQAPLHHLQVLGLQLRCLRGRLEALSGQLHPGKQPMCELSKCCRCVGQASPLPLGKHGQQVAAIQLRDSCQHAIHAVIQLLAVWHLTVHQVWHWQLQLYSMWKWLATYRRHLR